jgi:hypothetical protein
MDQIGVISQADKKARLQTGFLMQTQKTRIKDGKQAKDSKNDKEGRNEQVRC